MATPYAKHVGMIALSTLAVSQAAFPQCPRYSVDIYAGPQGCQILPSWAGAFGISDSGDMCGGYNVCGGVGHHVIWSPTGQMTHLPPSAEGGIPDSPFGINVSREVVGRMYVPSLNPSPDRAFYSSNGVTINLGALPGATISEAYSISADRKICGYSNTLTGTRAVIWDKGTMSAMALPLGPSSVAYDISDNGSYICGWMGIDPAPNFGSRGFRWNNGTVIDLGLLPESDSIDARGVNNLGQVCGMAYFLAPESRIRGFLWSNGVMQEIGVLPSFFDSRALDLNDRAQVIGYCERWPIDALHEPFVWQNGVAVALDDLVAAEMQLDIQRVWSINNAGQIAGYATRPTPLPGDEAVAVRLTPIIPTGGDTDCNGRVDINDLLAVIKQWGPTIPTTSCDFDNDGNVDVADLMEVIRHWTS